MLRHTLVFIVASLLIGGVANPAAAAGTEGLERVTQTLVAPPFLPAHEQTSNGPHSFRF